MTWEQAQEFERLRAEDAELRRLLAEMQQQLAAALERIAESEAQLNQRPAPPAFVKPNRQKQATGEPQPPKKRAARLGALPGVPLSAAW